MTLDFSHCRLPPFKHQREDTAWLLRNPHVLIASEMRTGKSKIVIDAAQFLYEEGRIDNVVVVAPAPVRDVWADRQLGEIAKHAWTSVPNRVTQYHIKLRSWANHESKKYLEWYVTNFEFLRNKVRLDELISTCGPKTLLVLDESSFVKNHASLQTKACMQLRKKCGRVVLLNGTPIFHSPLDLFSQGNLLAPHILDCKFVTLFKARYALQAPVLSYGGKPLKKIVGKGPYAKEIIIHEVTGWTNLEDLQARFAPYTVRRLQAECLDLPPKLDPVTLTATLEPEEWRAYKEMRDEFVVWLQNGQVVTSATAAIKALRLSQITGGFLSGAEGAGIDVELTKDEQFLQDLGIHYMDEDMTLTEGFSKGEVDRQIARLSTPSGVVAIGRAKLDVLLWFIEQQLEADPNLHLVAWTRFIAECERAVREVKQKFPQFAVGTIQGNQTRVERLAALSLLKPETSPEGPVFVCGIEGTGSFGLDMTAAHTCVTLSSGYSPGRSAQTLDRVYGPGQKHPIAYFDIVAVGPRGQKTIDHDILIARRAGEDVAHRTAAAWVKAITDE